MHRRHKIALYTLLVTLTLWLGGVVPFAAAAPTSGAAAADAAIDAGHAEAVGDAAHGGGGEGLLLPDILTFIWQIVLFVVLFAVLAYFVWPRILSALQGREERMRSDLLRAENANKEATATLDKYKAQLAEAQRESGRIIEEARTEAQRAAARVREEAQRDIQQTRERLQQEIRTSQEQAVAEVYERAATIATDIAGKILQREITPEDQQRLIDQSLQELEAAPPRV